MINDPAHLAKKRLKTRLVCSMSFGLLFWASAEDIYIAQNAAGSNTGVDPANAHSIIWLNTAGNWGIGTGKVSAGVIVHLCGTITNTIGVYGNGIPGSPVTIFFEQNAKLTQPAGTLVSCQNRSNIVFDGNFVGIMENTDNGTLLGHQAAVSGIYASGAHDLEVRNLTMRNFYVHTSTNDGANYGFDAQGALYMNGFGSNISVHNCTFSNICWVLNFQGGSGGGMSIYSNYFLNFDHGVAGLGNSYSNVNIYNNHFGSTADWDTTINRWHHDGIHIFFGAGGTLSHVNVYNNLFDGDWGINNTAHLFFEGDYTHANPNALSNFTLYNNVFIQIPGNYLNNGFAVGGGPNWSWYNNTFVGSGVANSSGLGTGGAGNLVANNLFNGLTTFVNVGTNSLLNNNIYANWASGGNSPWMRNGTSYNTFASWQTASGEANSIKTSSASINADGTVQIGSPALGVGANLSSIFTTDSVGNARPTTGAWTIGAYQNIFSIQPPSNLHVIRQQ